MLQNVGQIDSWTRFMKIVEEARVRTSGGDATLAAGRAKDARAKPVREVQSPHITTPVAQAMSGAPKMSGKAVGNLFDAYA